MAVSTGLLVMRIVSGFAFIYYGSGKIMNPFGWMGPDAPIPGVLQALAAVAEFGGGIAWILGFLTPLASLGLWITMSVAIFSHISRGDGFANGFEHALDYWMVALLLMLSGPGRFSVDHWCAKRCRK